MIEKMKKAYHEILERLGRIEEYLRIIQEFARNTEAKVDRYAEKERLALGRIENRQIGDDRKEWSVFSQWGEDGIIQDLIHHVNISKKMFVEFGVENYTESNTRFLLINDNWSGLVMDGSEENIDHIRHDPIYWTYNVKAVQAFITADNINALLEKNGVTGKIGLLSIDIDGNDYWVWERITVVDPDLVIIEYNPRFGTERAVTIPYSENYTRFSVHYSGIYFGASIKALVQLGKKKGYALVYGNEANLFFCKKELCNDVIRECTIEDAYVKNQYQDSRNQAGEIERISYEEEQEILSQLPLVNLEVESER